MKTKLLAVSMLLSGFAMAGQKVSCVQDYRAVDGGLVHFELLIESDHQASAQIKLASDSPAASDERKITLRALSCKDSSNASGTRIECTGPFNVKVDQDEVSGGPMTVTTSYENMAYTFGNTFSGPTKNYCLVELVLP